MTAESLGDDCRSAVRVFSGSRTAMARDLSWDYPGTLSGVESGAGRGPEGVVSVACRGALGVDSGTNG